MKNANTADKIEVGIITIPENTPSPWDIVYYEADMLFGLVKILEEDEYINDNIPNTQKTYIKNAIAESICLHTRILAGILTSKSSSNNDDITLKGLKPDFTSSTVAQLTEVYGKSSEKGKPCWTINKMLAHATKERSNSYCYTNDIKEVVALIKQILTEINNYRDQHNKQHNPITPINNGSDCNLANTMISTER